MIICVFTTAVIARDCCGQVEGAQQNLEHGPDSVQSFVCRRQELLCLYLIQAELLQCIYPLGYLLACEESQTGAAEKMSYCKS